jgi:hypothetical protein
MLPKPHLWDLRNDRWQPLLLRNPWADYPLPDKLLPVAGYTSTDKGEFMMTPGTKLADILGLLARWPPEDIG